MSILSANFFQHFPKWLAHQEEYLTVQAPWIYGNGEQMNGGQLSTSRDPIHEGTMNGAAESTMAYGNEAFSNGQSSS
jgi:hypothetical protein